MKISTSLLLATGIIFVSGCTKPKPTHTEALHLHLIKEQKASQKIDKKIIVLQPSITMLDTKDAQRMDLQSQLVRLKEGIIGGNYDFNKAYKYKYGATEGSALKEDLTTILRNEGFEVIDEYQTYDDIDYSVRKSAYLIIKPEIKAAFITSNVKKEKSGDTITEHGLVRVIGTISLVSMEPLSKERISTKKIDLSKMQLEKPYTSIRKVDTHYSYASAFAIGQSLGKMTANAIFGSSEIDNTQNTLVSMVNAIHAYAIKKIKPRLQKEDILSYENDIKEIKSKKRY